MKYGAQVGSRSSRSGGTSWFLAIPEQCDEPRMQWWERESSRMVEKTVDDLVEEVRALIREGQHLTAAKLLLKDRQQHLPFQVTDVPERELARLIHDVPSNLSADLVAHLDPMEAAHVLEETPVEDAANVLDELDRDVAVPVLEEMAADRVEEIAERMPGGSDLLSQLQTYPEGSVGRLMTPQPFKVKQWNTAGDALDQLKVELGTGSHAITYFYVVDENDRLMGVAGLRSVLSSPGDARISEIMNSEVVSVVDTAREDECLHLLHRHRLFGLPVVNEDGILVGLIRADRLVRMAEEMATHDLLALHGASESRETESVADTIRHRLPWLVINLATVLLAATVVGIFQGTIESVVALAVFLPVLAGHGSNTGMQTVAVIVRTLALTQLSGHAWRRMLRHELSASFINGTVIGLLAGIGGALWGGSAAFGLVIGVAALASTLMASATGTLVPILLKAAGHDPATGSGVVVTTFTDMTGFAVMLGLATLIIHLL